MVFYVYELRDPDTMIPFYVGKGSGNRMRIHENAVRNWATNPMAAYNPHLYNKIKKILDEGKRVKHFKLFETEDENIAFEKEKELIKVYREAGFKLCNILDGGEGNAGGHHPHSEETKQRIGTALKGKPKSEEHKEALRQAKLQHPVRAWKDKKFSKEHKENLREAKRRWYKVEDNPPEWLCSKDLQRKHGFSPHKFYKLLKAGAIQEVENGKDCQTNLRQPR